MTLVFSRTFLESAIYYSRGSSPFSEKKEVISQLPLPFVQKEEKLSKWIPLEKCMIPALVDFGGLLLQGALIGLWSSDCVLRHLYFLRDII